MLVVSVEAEEEAEAEEMAVAAETETASSVVSQVTLQENAQMKLLTEVMAQSKASAEEVEVVAQRSATTATKKVTLPRNALSLDVREAAAMDLTSVREETMTAAIMTENPSLSGKLTNETMPMKAAGVRTTTVTLVGATMPSKARIKKDGEVASHLKIQELAGERITTAREATLADGEQAINEVKLIITIK